MHRAVGGLLRRVKRQFVDDLEADPYLPYILLLATVLAGFWFWHRVPNFATRDERWRILDPMVAVGTFAEDPGVDSLKRGIRYWRVFGATFYLYGIVLVPVFVAAFLTGEIGALAAIPEHQGVDLWAQWNRTPAWIWTASILLARLANVALAVGCVYVVYRIGTTMRDRATGRLAAVLLAFTWGFLILAHEAGEDIPALFFTLLVVYFGLRYARTGDATTFLAACASGGIAIAFKLTAGVCVILIAVAYVLRVRNAGAEWVDALLRPSLVVGGAALGAVAVFVGFPTAFVSGFDVVVERIVRGSTGKGEPHGWRVAPSWWWILRGYLHGLGLPLFVAAVGAAVASVPLLRERSPAADGIVLSMVGIAGFLLLYARWAYVRTHHLLPTFPLLILILAAILVRLHDRNRSLARPLIAVLLISSGIYAGVGDLGYATQPRDRATAWLGSHAPANATVETYTSDPQEAAIPHGMRVYRPSYRGNADGGSSDRLSRTEWTRNVAERCPDYIELNYHQALLYLAPDSHSARAERLSSPQQTEHFRALLAGEISPYRVVATFGPRPPYLGPEPQRTRLPELLRVGLFPRTIQYGDPQDLGVNQYTVILERTGSCNSSQ